VVERELGVSPSRLGMGAGGELSAAVDDGDSTWEDVEEEDEDLAAAMARKDEIDIVGEVEEMELKDRSNYAMTTGRKVSHISI